NELVVGYLAAWNERDSKRRRELIAKIWAEDGTYIDAHRRGVGQEGIDSMIAAAQAQFPGYRLQFGKQYRDSQRLPQIQLGRRRLSGGPSVSWRHGLRYDRVGWPSRDSYWFRRRGAGDVRISCT